MAALELEGELLPFGTTAAHIAVNSGDIGALRNLLDGDRSLLDQPDHFGHPPLSKALQNGRLEAARLLVEYGANLDSPYGAECHPTLAQVLISNPAFVSLLHSVVHSNTGIYLDLSCVIPRLAYEGNVDMLEVVLSRPNVNVDCKDNLRCTGLHYASSRGFLVVVRLLLARGANRQLKTSVGATALHLACSAGHLEVVVSILEENMGSDTSPKNLLSLKNSAGDTPIVCAFRNQHLPVVQYILSSHLEQLDLEEMLPSGHRLPGLCFYLQYWTSPSLVKSPYLSSALPCLSIEESQWLLHESVHSGSREGVREAIEYGASVECLDYMLQTPLMLAAKLGSVDMCKCIVESGASLNVVDMSGKTALMYAYDHGKHGVVRYLLSQPACDFLDPCSLPSPIATTNMLAVLVSYLEGKKASDPAGSTGEWLAWLALAAPTAPCNLFQALVSAVAPNDWVRQLCSTTRASTSNKTAVKACHRVAKYPTLPAYVQEDIAGDSHKPRPKLVRSFSRPRQWYFARAPPSTTKEWIFKTILHPKKPPSIPENDKFIRKYFTAPPPKTSPLPLGRDRGILGRVRILSRQDCDSVVHSAALHNLDVLRFILSSCEDAQLQEKVLLLRDEAGRTALELALPQFRVISDACSSLGVRETGGLDEYLTREFTLPESYLFEDALLHYICVGKHKLLSQKHLSPLHAWPLWYLQLQVNAFCLNNESGLLQVSELEDRKKLLDLLLEHQHFPAGWNGDEREYAPPLFTAVQHRSSWAVEPLLTHGADHATHHKGRFAIEVAARHGQVETVQKLLEGGLDPFLALPDRNKQLFSSLSSSLEYLVRLGLIEGAVNLLVGLSLGRYLWPSPHASSFLFTAQARCDGSEEYEMIVRDFVNFLGTHMRDLGSEGALAKSAKSVVVKNMKLICQRVFFKRARASSSTRSLLTLCSQRTLQHTLGELFRSFCGDGNNHMVCFILDASSPETTAGIINQPDVRGYTPLFYAACGGHVETVKLLLHNGAHVPSPAGGGGYQVSMLQYGAHPASSADSDHQKLVLQHGAQLLSSADSGHKDNAKSMLQYGVHPANLADGGHQKLVLQHGAQLLSIADSGQQDNMKFVLHHGAELPSPAHSGHQDNSKLMLHHGASTAGGGQQDNTKLLVSRGTISIANCRSCPPIIGALVYLVLAHRNIGGDILGKRYKLIYEERGNILGYYWGFVPRRSFPMLIEDPNRARELVTLLLPPPTESILDYHFDFPSPNQRMLTILHLISAIRDMSAVEPLLERVSKELPVSCGRQLRLKQALFLAPESDGSRAYQLFESFLVRFLHDTPLPLSNADIFLAARKGYWAVAEAAVSNNKLELKSTDGKFINTCLLAVKFGKSDLLCGLLKVAWSTELPLSRWWLRLAVAVVRANHPDMLNGLLSVGCDVTCCLRAAVRLGSTKALGSILESFSVDQLVEKFSQVVTLAAKCKQHEMVQFLFDLYRNCEDIAIVSEFSREVLFWVLVLEGSVSHGHQSLALVAVSHISDSEMKTVSAQRELFGRILYYSCYWGLTDLLSCLPYSENDLMERDGERESPLEAAMANGRLGCIPSPPARFVIWDDFKSWLEKGQLEVSGSWSSAFPSQQLTGGFFNHMLSATTSTATQNYKSVEKRGKSFLLRRNAFQLFEEFTRNFCAPLLMHAVMSGSSSEDIPYSAALEEDSTILEQILRVLFNSGYLSQCFEHSRIGDVHSVARYARASSLDLLLRCGKVFVNRLTHLNGKRQNVLHSVVLSTGYSVDKMDLLLDQLGHLAPDMCLAIDKQGHSPISLAFSNGKFERADRLLKEAVKSSSFSAEENPAVKQLVKVAHKARGWFRAMIESGESPSEGDPKRFSVRDAPRGAISLFKKVAYEGNDGVVRALLVASTGLITTDIYVLVRGLLNKAALDFLSSSPSYIPFIIQNHPDKLTQLLGRRDFSEEVVFLIQLVDEGKLQVSLDLQRLFLTGCVHRRLSIVKHLLSRTPSMLPKVLQRGAEDAFTFGALEIAAEILLSTDSATMSADFVLGLGPVVRQIFIAPRDYQTTVEDFFESIAHPGKLGRLPFSEQWLAHEWQPHQRQLVERATHRDLPSSAPPPNPWMIGINWRSAPHTVELTIDWESFTECLLEPPLPVKQENTPMLVEAIVFSSSVLGQLYPTEEGRHATYNLADFFDTPEPPEYVVLSSVKWPSPPTCESNKLCLSYRPHERVFVFPPVLVQRTERIGDESYSTDSGMHSLSLTNTSVDTREDEANTSIFSDRLQDLCKFHQRKLRRKHRTSTDISVEAGTIDPYLLLSVCELCSEALVLSTSPTTTYASFHSSSRAWRLPASPPKNMFGHIGINIECATEGEPSSGVVSLIDSGIDFSIALAADNSSTSTARRSAGSHWIQLPPHEDLLEQTVECTLQREVQLLRDKLCRFVRTVFLPRLQRVLRSEPDYICLLLEDASGNTNEPSLATVSHLLQLKSNKLIKLFLLSFCDILRAYSHKPRIFSDIRGHLQGGLSVIISETRQTDITASPPGLQLVVHTSDLCQPQRQSALVSLTESLLRLSQESSTPGGCENDVKTLLGEIPCPFLTHVEFRTSSVNFLYPVVGSAATLTVQVMGYGGNRLTLPLKYNCCLQVTIECPSGKTLSASSSEEPSSHRVSGDLCVTPSADGLFEVVWKPTQEGLHTVHTTLNGVSIHQSFRRVYVEGSRCRPGKGVVSAGEHLVFVAAHVGGVCQFTSQNTRVVLIRDTIIEPSPLLKDFPGFQTFISPSTTVNTSPLRPSDQLKRVVSSMKGQQEGIPEPPLPLLHHMSITAAHGGSKTWSHTPTSHVTIHTSIQDTQVKKTGQRKQLRTKKKDSLSHRVRRTSQRTLPEPRERGCRNVYNATCVSLGHGMYRVSLQCTRACTHKVFASCPLCQSVMRIRWLEAQSFYPQPFYVVPGPFSPATSTVTDVNSGREVDSIIYKPGVHSLFLDCRDSYGNSHTVGGAIKSALILGAGVLKVACQAPSLMAVRSSERLDSVCQVKYIGQGRYLLDCSLLGAGIRPLVVTSGDPGLTKQSVKTMCMVRVAEDSDVCPKHCWLDPTNVYESQSFKPCTCYIYLYDQYFNPYCNGQGMLVNVHLGTNTHPTSLRPASTTNCYTFTFTLDALSTCHLTVSINGVLIADPPQTFTVLTESFPTRLARFREQVARYDYDSMFGIRTMIRVNRSKIMETAVANRLLLRERQIVVNFEGESGIDAGGISREFFQLLSQELVNPQYALFYSSNGLHRPSPHSSVNPSHLNYFTLCGEILARMLCDNYQTCVRFTPAVYKFLLGQECTLTDLKAEDTTLHDGLMEVARCGSEESLGELVTNFTTTLSHFGSLKTVELERGGQNRKVTLRNRDVFIHKFCHWHLIGCIKGQLSSMLDGFESTIPPQARGAARSLAWHELELLLCGQPAISVSFIKSRTYYDGYAASSTEIVWLWQVMEQLSQEELSWFLQFTTGSRCLPITDSGHWKLKISRGPNDESLLPTAATCFNSLTLPRYTSQDNLQQKLKQAITFGHLHFLHH